MYELLGSASEFIVEYRIIFIVYLSLLNLTAFVFYAADKILQKAADAEFPKPYLYVLRFLEVLSGRL